MILRDKVQLGKEGRVRSDAARKYCGEERREIRGRKVEKGEKDEENKRG